LLINNSRHQQKSDHLAESHFIMTAPRSSCYNTMVPTLMVSTQPVPQ